MIRYLGEYPGVFEADQIRLMGTALDDAWTTLRESHTDYTMDKEAESTRAALAKHIIEAFQQGEHDPRRLSEGAVLHLAGANRILTG